jgi:hypothetical protein
MPQRRISRALTFVGLILDCFRLNESPVDRLEESNQAQSAHEKSKQHGQPLSKQREGLECRSECKEGWQTIGPPYDGVPNDGVPRFDSMRPEVRLLFDVFLEVKGAHAESWMPTHFRVGPIVGQMFFPA